MFDPGGSVLPQEQTEWFHDETGNPTVVVRVRTTDGKISALLMPVLEAHSIWLDSEGIASIVIYHHRIIDGWGGSV